MHKKRSAFQPDCAGSGADEFRLHGREPQDPGDTARALSDPPVTPEPLAATETNPSRSPLPQRVGGGSPGPRPGSAPIATPPRHLWGGRARSRTSCPASLPPPPASFPRRPASRGHKHTAGVPCLQPGPGELVLWDRCVCTHAMKSMLSSEDFWKLPPADIPSSPTDPDCSQRTLGHGHPPDPALPRPLEGTRKFWAEQRAGSRSLTAHKSEGWPSICNPESKL